MPTPVAVCLEDLEAAEPERLLVCVVLVGRQPGLRLTASGQVTWQDETGAALELWVTADDRIALYRRAGSPLPTLERAGRRYDVPAEKPVIVLHQDLLTFGGRRLRLHVHGPAQRVVPPAPLRRGPATDTSGLGATRAEEVPGLIRDEPPDLPIEVTLEGDPLEDTSPETPDDSD